jgi:hypothetical protein
MTKKFSLFFIIVGSGIGYPGWKKIRMLDKHPGSTTLFFLKLLFASEVFNHLI